MFWRERARESTEKNSVHFNLCGQVRVLIVGDSGVGKTSLVNLITKGTAIAAPSQTVGCAVDVKHIFCGSPASSSNAIKANGERGFFVELWDVSGHERYKDCRALFYNQINGVIFVHDLSQRKTKPNMHKWAAEIAATGTFSAPLGSSSGFSGLPVPYLVIGNKADIADKDERRGSSGNLVDVARQWVEKQGLLQPSPAENLLPLTGSFQGNHGNTSLIAAAKEARFDKEAITKFFRTLIWRRYFSDDTPVQNSWSSSSSLQNLNTICLSNELSSDDDKFQKSTRYSNTLPPLPAQHNLTPPSALYPQQPMHISDSNYTYQRFSMPDLKINRADINV